MDGAMYNDQQQQCQSLYHGYDNNAGRLPHNIMIGQQDPFRKHTIERPTDFLKVMREAGIHPYHKLCLYCGEVASQGHRNSWRRCRNPCVFDPTHTHIGKLCPYLLQEANDGWCFSRADDDMHKDLAAARRMKKQADKPPSEYMQALPPPHQLPNAGPISFGVGVQQPGFSAGSGYGSYGAGYGRAPSPVGYTAGYGMPLPATGRSTCTAPGFNPGYGAGLAQPNERQGYMVPGYSGRRDNSHYTDASRPRDVRERSPTTQASNVNYRDRTPWARNEPTQSFERGRSSLHPSPMESSFAAQLASLRMQSVVDQEPVTAPQIQSHEVTETARVVAAPSILIQQSDQQQQTQAAELAELREQLADSQVRYRTVAAAFVRHMVATQHLLENMQSLIVLPPTLDANAFAVPPVVDQAEGSGQAHMDAGSSIKREHE